MSTLLQSMFTLRPTHGPWWVLSWEELNKLYASIGFPILEREQSRLERISKIFQRAKTTAANL